MTRLHNLTNLMNASKLKSVFDTGLDFNSYLTTDPSKAERWMDLYQQIQLSNTQTELIRGFKRQMRVLCISGIWCGDCVQQGPLLERIANANECIDLRWIDRDTDPEFTQHFMINAGNRVPVVLFMAEDFEPVSVMGDRTLSRYRAMAQRYGVAVCPLPSHQLPTDESHETLQEWLNEFERVHLLLRLSGRLRSKHGD